MQHISKNHQWSIRKASKAQSGSIERRSLCCMNLQCHIIALKTVLVFLHFYFVIFHIFIYLYRNILNAAYKLRLIFKNAEIFQRFITGVGPTAIGNNVNSGTNSSTVGSGQQSASGNGSGTNPISSKVFRLNLLFHGHLDITQYSLGNCRISK